MSKIIQLTAEHVKRLNVVEIKPDGNVIVIGGRNGQGKSSVLDSIVYALGGDPADPMPVHKGEDKAKVVVDLGDIVVQRTMTAAGGGQLVVKNKDGVRQSSPQAILDQLVGKLTFDPLDFARQKPPKQAEILRAIVGLDFAAHDKLREKAYELRTTVNRDAKALEARMNGMPQHADAPAAEQSAAEILEEQRKAANQNADNEKRRHDAISKRGVVKSWALTVSETEKQLEELKLTLQRQQESMSKAEAIAVEAEKLAAECQDVDLEPFKTTMAAVERANQKFRENQKRAEVVTQYKAKTADAEKLTAQIEELDSKKRRATTEAKYPIEGLSFDAAGGVTLNGIPFQQASAAEQLRVSVAIGLALNPKLRVMLIRDGSLLDEDSMNLLAEMAQTNDAQVWVERVGVDAHTSVVIEDGAIVEEK